MPITITSIMGRKIYTQTIEDGTYAGETSYTFECPGCGSSHEIRTYGDVVWNFNGDLEKPTVTPSLRVREQISNKEPKICHFFVREGKLVFCGDSTHHLSGKTVDMLDIN